MSDLAHQQRTLALAMVVAAYVLSFFQPLFALMGLVTASFTLTWACAKEVNPPLLSGMSTSVTNIGGFLAAAILQPMVGWVMDWTSPGGLTESGARFYTPDDFHAGLLLLAGRRPSGR
ncbi:hypothetical protein [Accumulibacter sp.]|uniref:hypothetical protein n=1 Tax=Accumulibacter sp. TaxID=2053492 RepID=UPI001A5B4C48|nr:hypothetical protein [Accumulibacter sp.]